jgi:hypothetical protein
LSILKKLVAEVNIEVSAAAVDRSREAGRMPRCASARI